MTTPTDNDDDGDDDEHVSNKGTGDQSRRISTHQRTGNKRYQQKIKSSYGYNKGLDKDLSDSNDGKDDGDGTHRQSLPRRRVSRPRASISTPASATRRRRAASPASDSTTGPPKKKDRLIINSDPFTPSLAGTLRPGDEEEEEPSDTSSNSSYNNSNNANGNSDSGSKYTETSRTHKKQKPGPKPESKSKSKSKSHNKTKKATTTTPKARKRHLSKNPANMLPLTVNDTTAADKMMLRMRGQNRSWKDITDEWEKLTGRRPGASSLSVRYHLLKARYRDMGDEDVSFSSPFLSPCSVLVLFAGHSKNLTLYSNY
jgi:hypothetical protein